MRGEPLLVQPDASEAVVANDGTLHLLGLLGFGGVHAIDRHLLACLEVAAQQDVRGIAIHGFLDGREGFLLCLLSAYSVFLKYAKAWEQRNCHNGN